jgi:hypothetical protein
LQKYYAATEFKTQEGLSPAFPGPRADVGVYGPAPALTALPAQKQDS